MLPDSLFFIIISFCFFYFFFIYFFFSFIIYIFFFFFNDTAPTEFYTLSLHDALPISVARVLDGLLEPRRHRLQVEVHPRGQRRSEEHTSELQSHVNLVCRLLLQK